MADIVVNEGYAAVGYQYINVDDCWLEKDRDNYGQLVPDRLRFPRGIRSLADYVKKTYTVPEGYFQLCSILGSL